MTQIKHSENVFVVRIFLSILILIFSIKSFAKSEDIRDFEIEGISIGDSLLDYFSKNKINEESVSDYKDKTFTRVDLKFKKAKTYEHFQFHYKTNDNNFIIQMFSAGNFLDDSDDCKKQMFEIDNNLMNNFSRINRETKPETNHPNDPDAKINSIYYYFPNGGGFRVSCFDWSQKMQSENNWYDHIKVTGFTEEILQWFINKAY